MSREPARPLRRAEDGWGLLGVWGLSVGALAAAVKSGALVTVDRSLSAWAETFRAPGADAAANTLTFLGSSPWTFAACAVMGGWWLARGQRGTLLVFLGAGAAGLIIQALLRLGVGQWRPEVAAAPTSADLAARYDLAGFTSGHGFRSAFLYGWWARALAARRTRWASVGAAGLVVLILVVGATRIYLGRHWPSDVLGAWLVALVALSLARKGRDTSIFLPFTDRKIEASRTG